jgi:hypothetical protein
VIPFDTANPFSDGFDAGYGCLPLTRLAVYGAPGPQYGDFSGKVEQVVPEVEVETTQPTGGWVTDPYEYETRRRQRLKDEREAEATAREAIRKAQEAATADVEARRQGMATGQATKALALAQDEAQRLIDALEGQQRQDRNRRLAAVLLLA